MPEGIPVNPATYKYWLHVFSQFSKMQKPLFINVTPSRYCKNEVIILWRCFVSNFDDVITECIELGVVDRVRGGYRLNTKAELTVRLRAITHQTINKPASINVTMGNPSN